MPRLGPTPYNSWDVAADHADMVRPSRASRPVAFEAMPKPITIDIHRTAVIVIDMQNDFCTQGGWLDGIGVDVTPARAPIAPLQQTLPPLRQAGVPVIWLNWGNRPDLANISPALMHVYNSDGVSPGLADPLPDSGERVLTDGSWAAAIVDDLVPDPEDLHVAKYRMSGFWDTPLDSILRQRRIDTLLFAGVNADQCVLHTLADANFHGYDTILVEDLTATTSPPFCWQATLYNCRQIFGFTCTSEALLHGLSVAAD